MTANKEYYRSVTWDDGRTVRFNDDFEVEGFTKVTDIWPSESSIARNLEQRKALVVASPMATATSLCRDKIGM